MKADIVFSYDVSGKKRRGEIHRNTIGIPIEPAVLYRRSRFLCAVKAIMISGELTGIKRGTGFPDQVSVSSFETAVSECPCAFFPTISIPFQTGFHAISFTVHARKSTGSDGVPLQ
jgi:hypothetical protein